MDTPPIFESVKYLGPGNNVQRPNRQFSSLSRIFPWPVGGLLAAPPKGLFVNLGDFFLCPVFCFGSVLQNNLYTLPTQKSKFKVWDLGFKSVLFINF